MRPIEQETVLVGVLVAAGWKPSGEVTDIGLMTADEDVYQIAPEAWEDLSPVDFLRKRARLSAIVRNHHVMRVIRVELLPSEI